MDDDLNEYNRDWAKKNPEKRKTSYQKYNEKIKMKRKENKIKKEENKYF